MTDILKLYRREVFTVLGSSRYIMYECGVVVVSLGQLDYFRWMYLLPNGIVGIHGNVAIHRTDFDKLLASPCC